MFTRSNQKHIKHFLSTAMRRGCEATLLVAIVAAVPFSPNLSTTTDIFNTPACNINEPDETLFTERIAPAAIIDKTDCDGLILDDSAFSTTIVRDHTDESYAPSPTARCADPISIAPHRQVSNCARQF